MPLQPFNIDTYLATKQSADTKLEELAASSRQKLDLLAQKHAEQLAVLAPPQPITPVAPVAPVTPVPDSSWVGKLGLEPGSFVANRVNDAASLVAGAARLGGHIASLPVSMTGVSATAELDQPTIDAWNRVKSGTASEADMQLLHQRPQPEGPTALERLQTADTTREVSRDINDNADLTGIVNQANRQGLNADLASGFEEHWNNVKSGEPGKVVSGVAGLLLNAGDAIVHNPSAVREYILENAPQLAVGVVPKAGQAVMAASNIGYAMDTYQQGLENYAKAHGGQLPPQEQRQTMAVQAASLALAEELGDLGTLAAGKMIGAGKAAAPSLTRSVINVAKAAGEGVLSEAPTEAYQQYTEGQIKGTPATPLEIYTAGAIGGASGAGLAAGMHTLAETAGATPEKAAARAAAQSAKQTLDAAIESGDTKPFLDPASAAYAPEKAVQVLFGHSKKDDTTPEAKAKNLQQALEIVNGLDDKAAELTTKAKDKSLSEEERAAANVEFTKVDKQYQAAAAVLQNFLAESNAPTKTSVNDDVETIRSSETAPDKAAEAADRLITLSMTSPEHLDPQVARELADNEHLSTAQRDYLRAFSEARVAENLLMDMDKVSQTVVTGDENGNVGINQYRERMAVALEAGNRKVADRQLAQLQAFAQDHEAKATVARQALRQGMGTQITRTVDNAGWQINTGKPLSRTELRQNGGLEIKSARLVANIQSEAAALNKAVAELKSAYAIKFSTKGSEKHDVQDQSQRESQTRSTERKPAHQPAVQAPEAVGSDEAAARSGVVPGAGPASPVETGGLKDKSPTTEELAIRALEFLNNPPADYTPERGRKTLAWAEKKLASETDEDARSVLKQVIAKGKRVVEGDESLKEIEGEDTPPKAEEKAAMPTTDSGAAATETDGVAAAPAAPSNEGALSVLSEENKSPAGTEFKKRNLLADYFTQSSAKLGDATARPLVAVKDFLSSGVDVLKFLKDGYSTDPKIAKRQVEVIQSFRDAAKQWFPRMTKNLVRGKSRDFFFKDMMQFLIVENGDKLDLEENVKTAMAYGMYSWIAENAAKDGWNTDDDINTILQRDDDALVSDAERSALGPIGTRQQVITNALGQRAVQALGLKATKDAPPDLMANLQASIGTHMFKVLMDEGVVVRTTYSDGDFQKLLGKAATFEGLPAQFRDQFEKLTGREARGLKLQNLDLSNLSQQEIAAVTAGFKKLKQIHGASHYFIEMYRTADNKLHAQAQSILEDSRKTQGILNKLFQVEAGLLAPNIGEPVPFTQAKTKNTQQDVPSVLKKILGERNKEAYQVKQDLWSLVNAIDEDIFMEIAGAEHTDAMHVVNKASAAAKNKQLKTEIERIKDFVGSMADLTTPLFFSQNAWKQHRVGLFNNLINPQTSKVHRHLLANEAWTTEVDPANPEQLNNFLLRVGEGLGVKTDKKSNATNLPAIEALIQDPVIRGAVDALVDHLNKKELSKEQQQALLAGVKKGGEEMHSLDALMALAQMEDAGGEVFTTNLMGEVDGVANGPILSHLLMGAAASVEDLFGVINRGGFYRVGDGHTQYNLWREVAGHMDLYENTSANVVKAIQKLRNDAKWGKKNATTLDAIYAFVGNLEASDAKSLKKRRDIVKTPITSMIFGSSIMKSIENMKNQFIGSIYDAIQEAAANKDDPSKADAVLDNLNTVLLMGKGPGLLQSETIETLMQRELTSSELEAIDEAFRWSIGKAVETTMKQDFAVFLQQRDTFNRTANTAFQLYNAAATAMRDAFINELMDSNALPFREVSDYDAAGKAIPGTKHKEPLHELKPEQQRELDKRLGELKPVMHSLFSKQGNELNAGLLIAKSSRRISQRPTFESEVHFGTPFSDNNANTSKANGYEQIEIEPGARMLPVGTHSADSAVMHLSEDQNYLNIHDAKGVGPKGAQKAAQSLNASTWNVMLNYSPASEMADALARTVHALSALLSRKDLPPAVIENLNRTLQKLADKQKIEPLQVIEQAMQDARQMAFKADSIKLEAMSVMSFLDQYAFEGGAYEVSDADRASAASKLSQLHAELTTADQQAIDTITEALGGKPTKRETKEETQQAEPAIPGLEVTEVSEEDAPWFESEVLNVPPIQAMQLLEHGSKDDTLPREISTQMRQVLKAMLEGRQGLQEALKATLKGVEAAALVQLLARRLASLPANTFGDLGKSRIESDAALVQFFETHGQVRSQKVLQELYRRLSKNPDSAVNAMNLQLVRMLSKVIDPELPVVYVTPATAPDQVIDKVSKARGWYSANGFEHGVYVLSPDFKHSGLTPELLLHELTHGAVAITIDAELAKLKADPSYTSPALELIQDLENLREKAIQHANAQGIFAEHQSALSNIQEFVAWGMTNQAFQTEVLAKISMKSATKKNDLVTGMKEFIKTIVGLLFKDSDKSHQAIAVNGMTILVSNVSGLFAAAAKVKTTAEITLAQANTAADDVHQLSTLDLHEGLADPASPLDPSFDAHLRNLLGSIVEKLHGPFGAFKADMMKSAANSPMDVWLKALTNGVAPFASKIMASPLVFNRQEAHAMEQIEATVRAALEANDAHTKVAYKQLSDLYTEAYQKVKPNDFSDFDQVSGKSAQFDFIFKIEMNGSSNRSDYLARFAALGLGHQGFNHLLQFKTTKDVKTIADGKTFAEKLQIVFENILAFLHSKVVDTWIGQRADAKLEALVGHLVDIEARRRYALAQRATETPWIEPVEAGIKKGSEYIRGKVGDMASTAWVRDNSNAFIRATGAIVRTVANDGVEQLLEAMQNLRDRNHKGRLGIAASLLGEIRGPLEVFKRLLLATKNNERLRKAVITQAAVTALQTFEGGGKLLSKGAKAALSAVFLRTGAHVLLDHFNMAGIEKLIADKSELSKAIRSFEGQLAQFKGVRYYFINQANALGYYKATGRVKEGFMMMNAHNIASMYGTAYQGRISGEQQGTAVKIIETLVALYALEYSSEKHLLNAQQLLKAENARTDGNGVEFVLKLHKRLESESQARLFKNNPVQMIHGYTPEIYNPHTEIKVANEDEGQELVLQGYVKGDPVQADPADPDQLPKHFYVLRDGGLQPRLTGAFSYKGMRAKGSPKHNGFMNVNTQDGLANAQTQAHMNTAKQPEIQQLFQSTVRADLSKKRGTFAAPILNDQGRVVNYRYLMSEDLKDSLLERDNRFEKVLGSLAGSIFDKETSAAQNETVVRTLKAQYDSEYERNPTAYTMVGPKSQDAELREIWALLPHETREDVKRIWGREAMMVRKDSLDIMFGYRKLSLADALKKDPEARSDLERIFADTIEHLLYHWARLKGMSAADAQDYAKGAAVRVTRAERVWQEIVHETKDIFVVKTGTVLLGNIWSNLSLLSLQGVSLKEMVQHHMVALKGATAYQHDSAELARLQLQLDSGYLTGAAADEARRNVARLQDALARNPVKELIDAGLMPTIVEDLAQDDDIYSYKSAFVRSTEKYTAKLHPKVLDAAKTVYMAHDTKLYQGLSRITQLSDFVARYTLYQHQISKKNPLTKEAAIIEASDAFVNYDIPMHRGLQYADDMGIMMFTKYFLRMQRVLLKTARENPARVLMEMTLSRFMDLGPIVLEGSAFKRLGNNPLNWGAFEFFGALDELATVNAGMALLPTMNVGK